MLKQGDYNLYCHETRQNQEDKPTKIIDLTQFTSIETNNVDTFVVVLFLVL